jgi:hypothetical protein
MKPHILTEQDLHEMYIHRRYLTGTSYTAKTLANEFVEKGYAKRLPDGSLSFEILPNPQDVNRMVRSNAVLLPLGTVSNGGSNWSVRRVGTTNIDKARKTLSIAFSISVILVCYMCVKPKLYTMCHNAAHAYATFWRGRQ